MTDLECAWLAGLFDGEGNVTIYRDVKRNGHFCFVLVVTIGMTTRPPLDFIKENFGGSVSAKKKRLAHHSQAWHWRGSSQIGAKFLRSIRPYLRIKHAEVDCGLELQEAIDRYRGQVSEGQLVDRENLRQKLFSLRPGRPAQRASS